MCTDIENSENIAEIIFSVVQYEITMWFKKSGGYATVTEHINVDD